MSGSVLFVDDERGILLALRRLFHGASFDARFASGGAEALRLLEDRPADLVVADMRMPDIDGVTLLRRVRDTYPGTARVILSGQVDRDTAVRALSDGVARTFFAKPWDDEQLKGCITHILDVRRELTASGLLSLVGGLSSLPAAPQVYTRLTRAIDGGDTLAAIAAIVEEDVGLAAKSLQVINSAYYGAGGVTSVGRAIALLGVEAVRGIATMLALVDGTDWQPEQRRILEGIATHSVLVQRHLSALRTSSPSDGDDGWGSAGLLHDIGKVILLRHSPVRYQAICRLAAEEPALDFWRAERELGFAGTSHAQLGGWLLDGWNLPEPLVDAALCHHEPQRSSPATRTLVEAIAWVNDALGAAMKPSLPRGPAPRWLDAGKARAIETEIAEDVTRGPSSRAC